MRVKCTIKKKFNDFKGLEDRCTLLDKCTIFFASARFAANVQEKVTRGRAKVNLGADGSKKIFYPICLYNAPAKSTL